MNRFTKTFRNGERHSLKPEATPFYAKLAAYEDIEEFCEKVASQPIYEKYEDTGKIHKEDYTECRALFSFEYNRIELYMLDFVNYLELSEYGITWAFTKEELEERK